MNTFDGAGAPLQSIPFDELQSETRYPFVLLIGQDEVERILEARLQALGTKVHREKRVTGMR